MPHTVSRIKEFEKPELPTCIKRIFLLLIGFTNSARAPTDPLAWLDETMFYESAEGFISADLSGTLDLEGYVFEGRPPGLLFNGDDFFNPGLSLFLDVELGPSVYLPPHDRNSPHSLVHGSRSFVRQCLCQERQVCERNVSAASIVDLGCGGQSLFGAIHEAG